MGGTPFPASCSTNSNPSFCRSVSILIRDPIMALLTDLPAELRQHIIRLIPGAMPAEIRLDDHSWPDPVNQLLVTCKLLRADAIRVMSTWSFDCLISRSAHIERLPHLIRAIKALGLDNKVQRIRLLIWSLIEIEHIRDPSSPMRQHVDPIEKIVTEWIERLPKLPRGDIKILIVDATPIPQRIIEKRPQLVDANLRLFFTFMFLSKYQGEVCNIILHLSHHFNPTVVREGENEIGTAEEQPDLEPLTRLILGGRFSKQCRSTVEAIMDDSGISNTAKQTDACAFMGSFCGSDMPDNLSLHRLAQKCGIELDTGGRDGLFRLDVSGVKLLKGAQTNEVEPDKDFSALSPWAIGRASASAYYVNALDDEEWSRAVVLKLLTFAVNSRQNPGAASQLDFLPAPPTRRKLVHEVCHDLDLIHITVDGQFGKFVRVSPPLSGKTDHALEQSMDSLAFT